MAVCMNESVDTPLTMNFAYRGCIAKGGKVWVDIEFGNERVYTSLRYINPQIINMVIIVYHKFRQVTYSSIVCTVIGLHLTTSVC